MKENTHVAPIVKETDAPAPAKRVQSEETLLKADLRAINRDITALDKQLADYDVATKAIDGVKDDKTKLQAELTAIKDKLIDVMGLR